MTMCMLCSHPMVSCTTAANALINNGKVIGQKLDRSDQYMCMTSSTQFGHHIGKIWLEPLFRGMAGALVAEHPALGGQTHQPGHSASGFLQVVDVIRFVLYHAPGHTMRRQQHWNIRAYLRREAFQSLLHSLSQCLQKEGLEVPAPGYFEIEIIALQVCNRVFQCANVATHDDR